jgi:hypothetical protein
MAISKINNIAYASLGKFKNVTKANLAKMQNVSKPGPPFADDKCVDGMSSTSKWLSSYSNLPTTFTHASAHQYWAMVMHFEHATSGNVGLFDLDWSGLNSSGNSIYLYIQNFGETLFWLFISGNDGTTHAPIYTTSGEIGNEKVTLTLTATGDTIADIKLYVNGGSVHNNTATTARPKFTAAMNQLALGRRDTVFHFNGQKFSDFAIFGVAFTESEANEAYNSGTTLDMTTHSQAANLEHYWLMGDGADSDGTADGADVSGSAYIYDQKASCDLLMQNMDSTDIVSY